MTDLPASRRFGKRETGELGWIRISGRAKLACTVRNLSSHGAFLELTPPRWLPFRFVLELDAGKQAYVCEVRHPMQTGIGVAFTNISSEVLEKAARGSTTNEADDWRGIGHGAGKNRQFAK